MIIQPLSSFTADTDSDAANFPAAQLIFHAAEFTSGGTTWASRAGNLIATLSGAALKDTDGVYAASDLTVSSVAGTMPVLAGHCVVFSIGKSRNNSQILGTLIHIGDSTVNSIGSSNNYNVYGTGETSATARSGDPTTNNSHFCNMTYYDLTDSSSPVVYEVFANDLNEAIGSVTDAGPVGGFTAMTLSSTFAITALSGTTHAGARIKAFGMMKFATAPTLNELKLWATQAAVTQQIPASWINKAAYA